MKITRFDVHLVELPLSYPWETGYGSDSVIDSVLIKAYSSDGIDAWVETCPLGTPTYSPETAGSVAFIIKEFFAKLVIGKTLENKDSIRGIFSPFKGNSFAKAGVECCWWALESIRQGVPLRHLFGGSDNQVSVGDDFGIQDSLEMLLEKVEDAFQQGFPRVKLKMCKGWDWDIMSTVRAIFPDKKFHVDCNGNYTLDDIELFKKLDTLHFEMVEQPLYYRDLADHAALQKMIKTPVCLDESITCLRDAEQAIRLGSCQVVNIKVGRVGGVAEALDIHNICKKSGVPCWIGGMLESGIGVLFSLELATLSNITYPSDIFPSKKFHPNDVVEPLVEFSGPGLLMPSQGPYIGRQINEKLIDKMTVQKWVVK